MTEPVKFLLIDEYGRPIPSSDVAKLREDIAPVDAVMGRPPFQGHLALRMDPFSLGGIIRAADEGSSLEWQIIAEEIEEQFPHYMAVLSKRKRQVCQLPVTVEAAGDDAESEKDAELVREWLDRDILQDGMFHMLDGIGKGFSVLQTNWEMTPKRVVPCELIYMPQRFFEVSWKDGQTILLRDQGNFVDLMPHKFLVHRHPSKSGNIMRGGLTRVVAMLWMYSQYTMRDWALFCQAYGMPIRVGRYGTEASETDKRVLWRAVSSIAGDVSAIIPKSMEMEFVKDTDRAAGSTLYEKRGDWLNREVSKVVLGGTAGTDAIAGGHAVGREHRQGEQDVERFDAQLLSTTLTRQLVIPMVAFTYGPREKYPKLKVGQQDEVPLKDVIAAVADLSGIGLKVKANQILSRLGLDKPEDEDDTIGGMMPVQDVTKPPVVPPVNDGGGLAGDMQTQRWLGGLITRHSEAPPEIVEALTQRLAADAAGAMAGMVDSIRAQFDEATSMNDLVERLHALNLPPGEFAEAMARGMALANLVGQASLVSELRRR